MIRRPRGAGLLDALKSLDGEQVVIDIGQNGYGCDEEICGKPAVLYASANGASGPRVSAFV